MLLSDHLSLLRESVTVLVGVQTQAMPCASSVQESFDRDLEKQEFRSCPDQQNEGTFLILNVYDVPKCNHNILE